MHTVAHHRNIGLLKYWEVAQIPNFALAAPVLVACGAVCCRVFGSMGTSLLAAVATPWRTGQADLLWATPYAIHLAFLTLLLLFWSHVQIALRFATPGGMPLLWWGLAQWRHAEQALYGLVLYNAVASLLYAGFYPPA